MILAWFTQPPGKFSSYYQYDTITNKFCRVRLELGRQSSSGSTNDTFIGLKTKRYVGFSKDKFSSKSDKWSVNDDGELCYDGKPLPGSPKPGDTVYDTTNPDDFIHRGNPVTGDAPKLPPGVEPKHLELLVNDVFTNTKNVTIKLTANNAKPEALAQAIQDKVSELFDGTKFSEITDEMISTKLTSQMKTIRGETAQESSTSLQDALTKAEVASSQITEQIEEGLLTPTQDFEVAVTSLDTALTKAQTASSDADLPATLAEIDTAQKAEQIAIENIDTVQHEIVARQLTSTGEALTEASKQVVDWQAAEVQFDSLTEASTVEDYEREIGLESTTEEVL
jgi:hypothetical protein